MSRLIIVAGAGGAGKSFFLRLWSQHDGNAQPIKKFVSSNREPREIELKKGESDLIFDKRYDPATTEGKSWLQSKYPDIHYNGGLTFHQRRFDLNYCSTNSMVYNYNGTYYEVDKQSIDTAIQQGKNPIVIVRKCETIKRLLEIYSNALIIYVQSILSGNDLVKRLVALGESEEDARKRESRNGQDLKDYTSNIQQLPITPRVVINDFDENESSAVFTQIEHIYRVEIGEYSFKEKSIFVIQSYLDRQNSQDFFDGIKFAALRALGTDKNVYRADLRNDGSYIIDQHVWNSIDSCDCIICDVTNDRCLDCDKVVEKNCQEIKSNALQGVSSNVWTELGYAISTLRKRNIDPERRLIIVSKGNTVMPVDLGGNARVVHNYNSLADLQRTVANLLSNMFN